MVAVTPPFQAPDEAAHFMRAWSVAEFQVVAGPGGVVNVPVNVATLPRRLGSDVGGDWAANHYSPGSLGTFLSERISSSSRPQYTSAAGYPLFGYAPQALGIELARAVGRSPLAGLYLARMLNLLATVLLLFAAIRVAPYGKALFALVGLLPMFVFEAASVSPDGLAIAGCFLFFAMTLRLSTRSCVKRSELVALLLVGAILLNAKVGYAVVVLLVLMLLPSQFPSTRRWALWTAGIVSAALGAALVFAVTAPTAPATRLGSLGLGRVDAGAQLSYVLRHPFAFAKVLYDTFDAQLLGLDHSRLPLGEMAYGVLGWLAIHLPTVGLWAVVLAALIFLQYRGETIPTTARQRAVMAGTGLTFVVAVSLALYVGWTSVGGAVVNGLQGRYFIPIIPLLLFGLYGLRPRRERMLVAGLLAVAVVVVVTSLATLARYYY